MLIIFKLYLTITISTKRHKRARIIEAAIRDHIRRPPRVPLKQPLFVLSLGAMCRGHCHLDYAKREQNTYSVLFKIIFAQHYILYILQLTMFTNNLGSLDSGNPNLSQEDLFWVRGRRAP